MLQIRNAFHDDLPLIVEIYNSVIPYRKVTADTEIVSVQSREAWFAAHHSKRPLWMVENSRGKSIGWVSFQDFYGRPAYQSTAEISIYLATDARGCGNGKTVLDYSISHVSSLGIKTLLGFIFAHNIESVSLFESKGFECWGHLPNVATLDGVQRSLQIFGKHII